jgi:DNA-binding CsgD family transcriptional regulator
MVYAARHPERVEHLVLYGGYARGRLLRGAEQRRHAEAMISSIRAGWARSDPTFRHLFSLLFLPEGTEEQMAWYDELLWRSTTAEAAVRLYDARNRIDIADIAPQVTAPTLVVHARGDRVVPVEEGRLLASRIPDAQLVLLESPNHILLSHEPAWRVFVDALHAFLGTEPARPAADVTTLSPRELDVLDLVAAGLSNEAIADRLSLSVRTVERHLSNIYVKLRVSGKTGRTAAAVWYSETLRAHRHPVPGGLRGGPDGGGAAGA